MTKQTQSNKESVDQATPLTDEELDQVNGGYSEVEWTYSKSATERNSDKVETIKGKKNIGAQTGDGSI
jgi:bacteriocin-like protein